MTDSNPRPELPHGLPLKALIEWIISHGIGRERSNVQGKTVWTQQSLADHLGLETRVVRRWGTEVSIGSENLEHFVHKLLGRPPNWPELVNEIKTANYNFQNEKKSKSKNKLYTHTNDFSDSSKNNEIFNENAVHTHILSKNQNRQQYGEFLELRKAVEKIYHASQGKNKKVDINQAIDEIRTGVLLESYNGIRNSITIRAGEIPRYSDRSIISDFALTKSTDDIEGLKSIARRASLKNLRIAIPASLVSTYALFDFAVRFLKAPLRVEILHTSSASPLVNPLKDEVYDMVVAPSTFIDLYRENCADIRYVPFALLGQGSHSVILPPQSDLTFRNLRNKKLDILCMGRKTPQKFLGDMTDIGLLNRRKISISAVDPQNGIMLSRSTEALSQNAAVVAFFPMTMVLTSIKAGLALELNALDISRGSHVIFAHKNLMSNKICLESVVSIFYSSRSFLLKNQVLFRDIIRDSLSSDAFLQSLSKCIDQ